MSVEQIKRNDVQEENYYQFLYNAIDKSQALISFSVDGIIQEANANFLDVVGYRLDEIRGKHHRIFCDPEYVDSLAYKQFWQKLGSGEFDSGEYMRLRKDGSPVWLKASYNPIFDGDGKVTGVVKFASDVTQEKLKSLEFESLWSSLNQSKGVIEFDIKGNVQDANENFLNLLGYTLDEIKGKHHRIFCDSEYVNSQAYIEFWEKLNRGEFDAGEYRRIGKGGKEVHILASYNPVKDASGKPFKVVKLAEDISERKLKDAELDALSKTQAVINFTPSGDIMGANKNFLAATGYTQEELKGKHHRIFCRPEYSANQEYHEFWQKLGRGEFQSGEFERVRKDGSVLWLNAAYNPVFDLNGNVHKVVKYATDITTTKLNSLRVIDTLSETAAQLSAATEEFGATASTLLSSSQKTTEESNNAAAATDEVNSGIQTVAASSEEMSSTIKEIASNTNKSSQMAQDCQVEARKTSEIMDSLNQSSEEIGTITKVISSIAQQTNLLALNATIEAARAGEAGKGFAVVANEVKELAKQSAVAAEEISNKIKSIQDTSGESVGAVKTISEAIDAISSSFNTVAASVEEQSATTNEVSRIIGESRHSVEQITQVIGNVSRNAEESSMGAEQVRAATQELNSLATRLAELVSELKKV